MRIQSNKVFQLAGQLKNLIRFLCAALLADMAFNLFY